MEESEIFIDIQRCSSPKIMGFYLWSKNEPGLFTLY